MHKIGENINNIFCFKGKKLVYFYDYINNYFDTDKNTKKPLESIDYDKKIICYRAQNLDQNTEPKKTENIVCYDKEDNVLWKVHGEIRRHRENESFAGIGFAEEENEEYDTKANTLYATTYSGEAHIINIETGCAIYNHWVR